MHDHRSTCTSRRTKKRAFNTKFQSKADRNDDIIAASMEDNTAYQISQVLFSSRSGSTFSCEPFHQRMVHPEQVSSITQQMERLQRQTTLATQSEVPDNSDPTGVLAMINDPSPFSCDIASIIDECVTEMSIRTSYLEEAVKTTAMEAEQSQELPSSTSSSLPKKPAKKRKRKPPPNKIYECNWCRKAEFKSGQGLRFHKVLRCPVRETQLGCNFFKCMHCCKTFVTRKGLAQHISQHHQLEETMSDLQSDNMPLSSTTVTLYSGDPSQY